MRRLSVFAVFLIIAAASGCKQDQSPSVQSPDHLRIDADRHSWTGKGFSGKELVTDNYRIYSTATGRAIELYLPGMMEAAYENYLDLTGLEPRPQVDRMDVYVMGNREQWALLTRSVVPESQVNTYLSIQAGGYCYDDTCVFWDLGGFRTFPVAAHEGMHQFFAHRLEHPLPLWLEEGLCTLAEGHEINGKTVVFDPHENHERFQGLRDSIIRGDWVSLEELLSMHAGDAVGKAPGKAGGYYGQLWALALFIRSEPTYSEGLEKLFADAENGEMHTALSIAPERFERLARRRGEYNHRLSVPIFRRYICQDVERFERQYYAFAKKVAKLD